MLNNPLRQFKVVSSGAPNSTSPIEPIALFKEDGKPFAISGVPPLISSALDAWRCDHLNQQNDQLLNVGRNNQPLRIHAGIVAGDCVVGADLRTTAPLTIGPKNFTLIWAGDTRSTAAPEDDYNARVNKALFDTTAAFATTTGGIHVLGQGHSGNVAAFDGQISGSGSGYYAVVMDNYDDSLEGDLSASLIGGPHMAGFFLRVNWDTRKRTGVFFREPGTPGGLADEEVNISVGEEIYDLRGLPLKILSYGFQGCALWDRALSNDEMRAAASWLSFGGYRVIELIDSIAEPSRKATLSTGSSGTFDITSKHRNRTFLRYTDTNQVIDLKQGAGGWSPGDEVLIMNMDNGGHFTLTSDGASLSYACPTGKQARVTKAYGVLRATLVSETAWNIQGDLDNA